MPVNLFNTLGSAKQEFLPIDGHTVKLYTCGPTVYDKLHIGNWSAYIYWDVLVRTLIANDLKVDRVLNITDVGHLTSDADSGEDKLETGAKREGKNAWQIAEMYTVDFLQGMNYLGMIMPEHIVKATEYIPQQIDLVRRLKEKGYTYETSDGIYFDTSKFPKYSEFAGLHLDSQEEGARVAVNNEKRNPSDFALWKFTESGTNRDMQWSTPLDLASGDHERPGFPGWHLECSAIALSLLGDTIDIHTGGIDHIPIHHTNEIAQSEAATGKVFSHFWLHNNHMKVEGTKISKSLGNGYTLDDLRSKGFNANDIRTFILQGNYKNEANFTFENLTAAKNRVNKWRDVACLRHQTHNSAESEDEQLSRNDTVALYEDAQAILEALSANLDTPRALMLVDKSMNKIANSKLTDIHHHSLMHFLESIKELLGIDLISTTPDISDEAKRMIMQRRHARANSDWNSSDKIRDDLSKINIDVRDSNADMIWSYIN